jgi:hypothetical protein
MEAQCAVRLGPEDAIEDERVKVNVHVHRPAEALHARHHAGLAADESLAPRLAAIRAAERAHEHLQHPGTALTNGLIDRSGGYPTFAAPAALRRIVSSGAQIRLLARGVSVLAYDYRGYGKSEGAPSEEGVYLDVLGAYDHLRTRGIPASGVIAFGESLGSVVSAHLASRRPCAGLVLVSPMTSLRDAEGAHHNDVFASEELMDAIVRFANEVAG